MSRDVRFVGEATRDISIAVGAGGSGARGSEAAEKPETVIYDTIEVLPPPPMNESESEPEPEDDESNDESQARVGAKAVVVVKTTATQATQLRCSRCSGKSLHNRHFWNFLKCELNASGNQNLGSLILQYMSPPNTKSSNPTFPTVVQRYGVNPPAESNLKAMMRSSSSIPQVITW